MVGMSLWMAFNGALETLSVISIAPFLAIAANPGWVETNAILNRVYTAGGFESPRSFLVAVGLAFIGFNMLSNGMKVFLLRKMVRFTWHVIYVLTTDLHRRYLAQPYPFFLGRNSADLLRQVYTEINFVMQNFFAPLLGCVERAMVVILLVAVIVFQNPLVALAAGGAFGGIYAAIYAGLRVRIRKYGAEAREADKTRFMILKEGFESFKITKLLGLESFFADSYAKNAKWSAQMQGSSHIVNMAPRYFVESLGIMAIVGITLFVISRVDNFVEVIPVLGLYAFAFSRLLPSSQLIYSNFAKMRFANPRLETLMKEVDSLTVPEPAAKARAAEGPPLEDAPQILVKDVCFSYASSDRVILDHVNVNIERNQAVGILGKTGSGKTTLLDLMLGLLAPTAGEIRFDGRLLTEGSKADWQAHIGYVPQDIVLLDTTITNNIAFGVPVDQIDTAKVERVAKMAKIHEFILNDLPEAYGTEVGDRGVRLSGGQRQRLGIARALYREPSVLFFDEATSSLDTKTEEDLMQAIADLHGSLTIVIVAHRLNTLRNCDFLIHLNNGVVAETGSFDELAAPKLQAESTAAGQAVTSQLDSREES